MSNSGITLPELRAAFDRWAGTPVDVLQLRPDTPDGQVPAEIDILFFQPAEEDNLPEEELFTIIATAGMSTRVMPGPCRHIELVLRVSGRWDSTDLRQLGQALAELAVAIFREGAYLAPNVIVCDVAFPLYQATSCALITHVGVHSPELLPGISPRVQLLWIKPIHEAEARAIEEIGDIEASQRFRNEGIDWDHPKRGCADLRERPDVADPKQKGRVTPDNNKSRKGTVAQLKVETAIHDIWKEIEAWCNENAPRVLADLRPPASDEKIEECEAGIGISLPPDYRSSLKAHDGKVYLHDYSYLSIDGVLRKWAMITKLSEDGAFEGRTVEGADRGIIQDTWWHRAWIPFAEDGGGNMLCIDMAPGINGLEGQIIRMEIRTGPEPGGHKSFLGWLQRYKNDLHAGRYEVDESGFIVERL